MAVYNRTDIGFKRTGNTVQVPNAPEGRLMYYLNCMCTVLSLDDNPNINRLRRYSNYQNLTNQDRELLIHLCLLLNPEELINKCIFQNDQLCGDAGNEFYELETVRNNFLVAGNVMIGGRQRRVNNIMTFKMSWLNRNWIDPMGTLLARQRRERQMAAMRQQPNSSACIIL